MAHRKSYTQAEVKSVSFAGKYSLGKVAGLNEKGKEAYIIPLDMQNGFASIPVHSVRKNDVIGFKGSTFQQVNIVCHRYNPETGEPSAELPLCCQIAQAEKERKPEPSDAAYKAVSFVSWRAIIPVLILGTSEDDVRKKPSLKKLSLNGIGFSYLNMAESSYRKEIQQKVIEDLETSGVIEDKDGMKEEELLGVVQDYIQHSVIRVTNSASDNRAIEYMRSYKVVSAKNKIVGEISGEGPQIRALCKLLAGEVDPADLDEFYAKYPLLQEVNNQVNDYLTLFNDNVDSLVTDWEDSELDEYYKKFLGKQEQIDKYKDESQVKEEETVEFVDEEEEVEAPVKARVITKPVSQTKVQAVKSASTATAVKKPAVAVMEEIEEDYVDNKTYDTSDLETSSELDDVDLADDFSEEDYVLDEDDLEFEEEI